jgi:hypothetical protein
MKGAFSLDISCSLKEKIWKSFEASALSNFMEKQIYL